MPSSVAPDDAPGPPSTPRQPALPILWRDDDLVVIHKPAGWLVHRTGLDAGETRFVVQTLRDQLGQHVYPVHRLDKGTSGVLLMALHPEAARELVKAFDMQAMRKRYVAMVRGWPTQGVWTVDHALRPEDAAPDAPPQSARTGFRTLATLQLDVPVDRYPTTRAALVEASPETGRRHQIRRHLKHVSLPIIGDATHGKGPVNRWWASQLGLQRLWLHAESLTIPHPRTQAPWTFTSPIEGVEGERLNPDWMRLLRELPWQRQPGA